MTKMSPTERQFNQEVRRRVVQLREEHGWKQREMADFLGCPYAAYTKYESEKDIRAFPLYLVPRLAALTQTRIEWIITGQGPKRLRVVSERRDIA